MYKLRHPAIQSGSIGFQGRAYEVKNWEFEVDDLATANRCIEISGCRLLGVERTKTAKKIIVKRGQGMGDVLMMTPVMRKIKELNPNCYLVFACFPMFMELFKHIPYIDRVVENSQVGFEGDSCWILEADGSKTQFDYLVNCDGIAERADEKTLSTVHRIDIFGEVAGLQLQPHEHRMDYRITEEEFEWARIFLKDKGIQSSDKILGMAVRSTARNRNMDASRFREIAKMAADAGWRIIIFDHDPTFGWEGKGIINMAGKTTLRQLGALISHCTMFFGPDSGAWHLSSAINVPNVVYFGAMDWKLRVTMPRTKVIFRNVPCYPCNRYDCHWQNKYECIDIEPARCWYTIEAFDCELGTRPVYEVATLLSSTPKPEIRVEDSGYRAVSPESIPALRGR